MKAPIEMALDGVVWTAVTPDRPIGPDNDDGVPYATHEGVLDIMGRKLRCYRLNTWQAVFNAEDVEAFFSDAFDS